jgi:hypothetical protein
MSKLLAWVGVAERERRRGRPLTPPRLGRVRSSPSYSEGPPGEIPPAPVAGDPRRDPWLCQFCRAGCLVSEAVVMGAPDHLRLIFGGKARG